MIKKTILKINIFFSILLIFIMMFSFNVLSVPTIYFTLTNDPSSAYTNDANAIDSSATTYAYTTTYANDQWLECTFGLGDNDCLLSNSFAIRLGWYKLGSSVSAQNVDIELNYVESETETSWRWNDFLTDETYAFNTLYQITFAKLVYLHGIRIRSDDPSNSYQLRIYGTEPYHFVAQDPTYTYYGSTDFFDAKDDHLNITEICNNWINSSASANLDFSDYVSATPSEYFELVTDVTSTSYDCCNESCDNTSLTHFENFINATGTFESIYSSITGWTTWCNVTGNITGGDCPYSIIYVNYSDENVTLNLTVNCNTGINTTTYEINQDNWLSLVGAILFDNSQFFLVIMLTLWIFFVSKSYDVETGFFAILQFLIMIPTFLYLVSLSYLNGLVYGYLVSGSIMFASIFVLITGLFRR